jgi:hypothetical protein
MTSIKKAPKRILEKFGDVSFIHAGTYGSVWRIKHNGEFYASMQKLAIIIKK